MTADTKAAGTGQYRVLSTQYLVLFVALFVLLAIAAISPPPTRRALANSALLAAGATAIALPLGGLLAVLLTRCDFFGRRACAMLLGMLLFLPLYVQLCAWDACLGKLGWFSLAYGSISEPVLAGMRGAIVVHGLAAIPWVALLVGIGLYHADRAQEEAALLVASPVQVLRRITLPQTLPFVAAAAIWAVVSTTSEMTVTNIYLMNPGERTLTEQFYMTFALSANAGEASVAILPGCLALATVLALAWWMVKRYSEHIQFSWDRRPLRWSAARGYWPLSALAWFLVAGLTAVPLGSLISKAGFVVVHSGSDRIRSWSAVKCIREVATAPGRFADEFSWTLIVAALAATLALIAGTWLAWLACRGGWRQWPALAAVVLGLAIPGPLVGVALIWLMNRDLPPLIPSRDGSAKSWLLVLYDETPLAPILAQAIRALPLVVLIGWHSFRSLNRDMLAAAALDGAAPWQVLWRIAIPQRRLALAGGWLAALAIAAGDLAWVHLVTPPGMDLIQRRVFGLVHSGVEEQVAAISLVVILTYAALTALVVALARATSTK